MTGRDFRPRLPRTYSTRSSRGARTARVWGWHWQRRSSRITMAGFRSVRCRGGRCSGSRFSARPMKCQRPRRTRQMDGTVLVADDDRTIRTVLTQALTRAGCKVHATSSLTTLMRWIGEGKGDVVISDVIMPDGNGLEMLPKIAQDRPGLPVIVISAQNTIMTAIQAAEAEAYDYLPKPFDLPDLMKRTAKALDSRTRSPRPASDITPSDPPDDLPLIGKTPAMQALYRLVAKVMNTDLPVLICGESGTGKSLIAKALHDFSDRRSLPFVTVTANDLSDIEGPARILARVRRSEEHTSELQSLRRISYAGFCLKKKKKKKPATPIPTIFQSQKNTTRINKK